MLSLRVYTYVRTTISNRRYSDERNSPETTYGQGPSQVAGPVFGWPQASGAAGSGQLRPPQPKVGQVRLRSPVVGKVAEINLSSRYRFVVGNAEDPWFLARRSFGARPLQVACRVHLTYVVQHLCRAFFFACTHARVKRP